MLTSLTIDNFAIIAHLDLDFTSGMTAFTGETGAGKSIIIDALMLISGGRADAGVVRNQSDKCEISASFIIDKHSPPASWLLQHELDTDDDLVILRRMISKEGRSRAWINGQPFPLQKLRELALLLVNIHGQHQYQDLLHHATQRIQLDNFAGNQDLQNEVARIWQEWHALQQDLTQTTDDSKELALLAFQIEELEALHPVKGEADDLDREHHLLHNIQRYLQQCQTIMDLLENDNNQDLYRSLQQIIQIISSMQAGSPSLENALTLFNEALIRCQEAGIEIKNFATSTEPDPERLSIIENRLAELHQAARKYNIKIDELPDKLASLQQEQARLLAYKAEITQKEQRLLILEENYYQAATKLTASRQQHQANLAERITASIRTLGMPHGFLEIDITPTTSMQISGMDKVEYKICTNPGMPPAPLAKIASGGELSRISLAIELVTAQRGATPVLIFDEVDVGIGGATAAMVGSMLRTLADRLQIFCVTHQPQVAASAHNHLRVSKDTHNNQTFASITVLDEVTRIAEIARMLGGIAITDQTKSHAREMLQQANIF